MKISLTEFKTNYWKYLELVKNEDIYITKYGRIIAKLANPIKERLAIAESLFGVVKNSKMSLDEAKLKRILSI